MTIRYIFMALEFLLLSLFLAPLPVVCSGNIAGIILSAVLLVITAEWKKFCDIVCALWGGTGGRAVLIAVGIIVLAGVIYITALSVLMICAQEKKPDKPNVVVVLGCKVRGQNPSRMLRRRLNAAVKVLNKYPDVLCVVSGGQGEDEVVTEAGAMKKYLLEKGIDSQRIIVEDKSTTTFENIKFTLEILDEMNMSHDMTIVTDGFHEYRASLIAKAQGVENITAFPAYTEPRYLFTYWVREWMGLTHFFLLGN